MNRESFGSNKTYIQQRQLTFTTGEFELAMSLIRQVCERQFDGSIGSLNTTVYLSQVLFQNPLSFFEEYFAAMDSPHNKELRTKANEFIASPGFDARSLEQMKQFTRTI
jgi:hypothetical protein